MEEDIRAIPGNERAIDALKELSESGEAIGFLGAGVSAGLYPMWGELLKTLADEAVAQGLATESDRDYWLKRATTSPDLAAEAIQRAMGAEVFSAHLQELFSAKTAVDGSRFTELQRLIMQLNIKGVVTTNYDPGIIEARHVVRPEASATGYATWQDRDALRAWLSSEIFARHECPTLFAHGIYERSETLVLGVEKYRQAYGSGLFRRTFEKLWLQEQLLVIGFGFADQWVRYAQEDLFSQLGMGRGLKTRHVAILGLPESEEYSPDRRREFQSAFQAQVVFYRVKDQGRDHGELLVLLRDLIGSRKPRDAPPSFTTSDASSNQLWVHETTNDDRYAGREFCLSRLQRWANDPGVKLVAVTGMGGQGKTSLVGHWLKKCGGAAARGSKSLFYWSFFANRSVP